MPRPTRAILSATLLAAAALTGCSSSSKPASVTIPFKSPAVVHNTLPARYTCDGKNVSPPLEWGNVPSSTTELALFMLALKPIRGGSGYVPTVVWGMAGINPALHGLAAGETPPGAHLALTSRGKPAAYSVCPPKNNAITYQFALYAVPASITVPARFVGINLLRLIANPESSKQSNGGGAFAATYRRPSHRTGRHAVEKRG
jgi:phosphatidylethanolamine-binding protein (PEBP) family uncharacterized protein